MERTICGTAIHYELTGSGERRVVLLHGWGCDTSLMKPVADYLGKDMTVLNIDFPGHGRSGRPPEPWGVPEYAEATRQLLTELDFLPCSVIAHSFGGRVTIQMASTWPDMFEKLILTGAAGIRKPQTEEGKKRSEAFKKKRDLWNNVKKIGFLSGLAEQMQERLVQQYGSADYKALDLEMRKTFNKVIALDLADRLPLIRQSTLLVWGDKDDATPLWMGQQMEREIRDAGLVVLEGGTHFAYLEQAARFNTIAHHFLMG